MQFSAARYLNDWRELAPTLADWRADHPGLGVLALLPAAEGERIDAVQAICREQGIPLCGAVFPALIAERRFVDRGILLLRFDRCPSWVLVDTTAPGAVHPVQALAATASHGLTAFAPGKPTFFLIFDCLLPNVGSMLHALYLALGKRVHYAGINAGNDNFQPISCLFDGERRLKNGVFGMLTASHPVVRHAYPLPENPLRAVSVAGNRIDNIEGRPPFEVYRDIVLRDRGVELTRENFYEHAVHYPFGEISALDVLVRMPMCIENDGSLKCIGEVPANSLLKLLRAPSLTESHCIEQLAEGLRPHAGPHDTLLAFYCAGRRQHLGSDAECELSMLEQACEVDRVVGAVSMGEIDTARQIGIPQLHHAALVCCRGK